MTIDQLQTPAILLDLDVMEQNLSRFADGAKAYGKQLWPMMKTHKSTILAKMQLQYGATGALCGTLDEAETLRDAGFQNIMYAYPVSTAVSVDRVMALAKSCPNFIIRLDGTDAAEMLEQHAAQANVSVQYTIIVDSGLHRFGVPPTDTVKLLKALSVYPHLIFRGISTHPGHVYGANHPQEIPRYCQDETQSMAQACQVLREAGYSPDIVSSGSTPTYEGTLQDPHIGIYHPGNYIFNDVIQLSNGAATQQQCALTVLASVISRPREDLFICDAGAKCLGLDTGAHGNTSIKGYGLVVGHPELTVFSLSEEVGKLHVDGPTDLKVGDQIRIIPNHACSCANLTSYYIGVRGEEVKELIPVDIRGNATVKNVHF